jgi:Family of unknown function (DUF6191)
MTQWGLDTLFNPSKRHMDEEKRRLQATRQQVGDTSGGKRIDLESGKVRIGKKADGDAEVDEAAETAEEATDAELTDEASGTVIAAPAGKPAAKPTAKRKRAAERKSATEKELTPAQVRAAERRRRTAH